MVVEQLGTWKEVFEQIQRMRAGNQIDAFSIEFTSVLINQAAEPRFHTISSLKEVEVLAEVIPGTLPPFTSFELERGGEEVIGGKVFRVLRIRASKPKPIPE